MELTGLSVSVRILVAHRHKQFIQFFQRCGGFHAQIRQPGFIIVGRGRELIPRDERITRHIVNRAILIGQRLLDLRIAFEELARIGRMLLNQRGQVNENAHGAEGLLIRFGDAIHKDIRIVARGQHQVLLLLESRFFHQDPIDDHIRAFEQLLAPPHVVKGFGMHGPPGEHARNMNRLAFRHRQLAHTPAA